MPAPQLIASPPPTRYSAERTYALPDFWVGTAATRKVLCRDDPLRLHRALGRAEAIERALRRGVPLATIPEFKEWLDAEGRR